MSGQVMPISVIRMGSQLGHLKLSPVAEPTLDEHAETGLGDKGAVAQEGKIASFAAQHQRTDLDLGTHSGEADQLLVIRSPGIDVHVAGGKRQKFAQGNAQGVRLEDKRLDLAVFKLEGNPDGLGVRDADGDVGLGRRSGR